MPCAPFGGFRTGDVTARLGTNLFIHQRMPKYQRVPASAPANMRMTAPAKVGAFHKIMPAVQNTAKKIEAIISLRCGDIGVVPVWVRR